ncbi:glycoside hydrolase family 15 protein [Rhizobium ruizarguesonis]
MDANTGLIRDKVAAERSQEEAAVVPRAIENHGVIGDLATIALAATDGTLDFLCWPDFDSPTIFAALLDPERGGMFQIAPELSDARVTQQYLPDTNVLLTRWMGDKASGELTDFMYVKNSRSDGSSMVVRRFRVTRGSLKVRMSCTPRFEYATRQLSAELEEGAVIWRQANGEVLRLLANVPLAEIDGTVVAEITLQAGEGIDFILDDGDAAEATPEEMEAQTVAFWQNWARQSTYRGRWREMVNRSALALKLMTSRKHGSIVAAATFGLPETPGGSRNWDYRATWIRDASFTVYARRAREAVCRARPFVQTSTAGAQGPAPLHGGRPQSASATRNLALPFLESAFGYGGPPVGRRQRLVVLHFRPASACHR